MPPATSIRKFIDAVNARKSEIARKLDAASQKCKNNSQYRSDLHQLISAWDPKTQPLNSTLGNKLGLTPKEVSHINKWPNSLLAKLQEKAEQATNNSLSPTPPDMQFYWEIVFGGPGKSDQTIEGAAPNPITVTFLTPRQKIRTKVNPLAANIHEVEAGI